MKSLVLSLIFFTMPPYAFGQELVDPNSSKQIVSIIKDIQVGQMLEKTNEFKVCRDKNNFSAGDGPDARNKKIQEAEACFKKELSKQKDPKKLQELSENLNLQHYGLVRSKNVQDIQKYLTDKMIESLTGVNPRDQSDKQFKDQLKFGKKKIVDQKIFIDLYKTQLGKNALYEVSRFCFEDLRLKEPASKADNFAAHWANYNPGSLEQLQNSGKLNDKGEPKFGKLQDPSDKDQVYKDIFASIQGAGPDSAMDDAKMSAFFKECMLLIVPMCDEFQDQINLKESTVSNIDADVSPGAAACLTKSRIQDYKRALAKAELVAKQFKEMTEEDQKSFLIGLDKGATPATLFGTNPNDSSLDDLTNNSSADILTGGFTRDELVKQKAQECKERPELANCEGFISSDDSMDKAKHNFEMEMTLKREVEMRLVKELQTKKDSSLEDYLKENGLFEILKQDYKNMSPDELAEAVGESFEAKKLATLQRIKQKLGSRQVKKDSKITTEQVTEVIRDSNEERARLAQLVLFNNIITSYLTLDREVASGKTESAGRNINPWKKEEKSLQEANIDPDLFANLKASGDSSTTSMDKNNQIAGFKILDYILGAEKKAQADEQPLD